MVVFDNLGLVCGFLTWREGGGFHGFLILGFGMSLVYGEKMLRLGLELELYCSSFFFFFSHVLVFRVYYFSSPFFSFYIYFFIYH
jgi:hypothetical protein